MKVAKEKGCWACKDSMINYRHSRCLKWKSGIYKIVTEKDGTRVYVRDCHNYNGRK